MFKIQITFMDKNKLLLFIFVVFLIPSTLYSQNLGEILFGKKSKNDYLSQYTDNHKHKNGLGIQRRKNGDVYIGDFFRDEFSGRGMLISEKQKIENAPNAFVYVGAWVDGKKQGKGTCYAANGDIIYCGKFSDDKPVDVYPSTMVDDIDYFTMKEIDEMLYWGEVKMGVPYGFGLIVQEDGSIWMGTLKDGERVGLCLTVYGVDSWEVGNWQNGDYKAFNNSEIVANRRSDYVEARRKVNTELRGYLLGIATNLATIGNQVSSFSSSSSLPSESTSIDASQTTMSSKPSGQSSSLSGKAKNDCGSSWMIQSRTYSDYESQLIRDSDKLSKSDVKNIQNKMKSIRQKWESRGCPITKSSYEDHL